MQSCLTDIIIYLDLAIAVVVLLRAIAAVIVAAA